MYPSARLSVHFYPYISINFFYHPVASFFSFFYPCLWPISVFFVVFYNNNNYNRFIGPLRSSLESLEALGLRATSSRGSRYGSGSGELRTTQRTRGDIYVRMPVARIRIIVFRKGSLVLLLLLSKDLKPRISAPSRKKYSCNGPLFAFTLPTIHKISNFNYLRKN